MFKSNLSVKSKSLTQIVCKLIIIGVICECLITYLILPLIKSHVSTEILSLIDLSLLILLTTPLITKFVILPYITSKIEMIEKINSEACQIAKSERKYQLVSNRMHDGFFEWDYKNNKLSLSGRWESVFHISPESIIDKSHLDLLKLIHDDDIEQFMCHINQSIAKKDGSHYEQELRILDSFRGYVWVRLIWTIILDDKGDIDQIIGSMIDIQERKLLEHTLAINVMYDPLTGLFNRDMLNQKLNNILEFINNNSMSYALLIINIDKFKLINDTLGHNSGDELLINVTKKLREVCTESDLIFRLSSDEFAILHSYPATTPNAIELCKKIYDITTKPFVLSNATISILFSIGMTYITEQYKNITEIIRDADLALYKAKYDNVSKIKEFQPYMQNESEKLFRLSQDISHSIENNQIYIQYQPIFDVNTKHAIGVEALLRWCHPKYGDISLDLVISISESNGYLKNLFEYVLSNSCELINKYQKYFTDDFFVSINVSGQQLKYYNLFYQMKEIINQHKINPNRIHIELTESTLIDYNSESMSVLTSLIDAGFSISLDDFGTGYSSISSLYKLPFSFLKIDRSCVREITTNLQCMRLFEGITHLAKTIGIELIVEGVETHDQDNHIKKYNIRYAQGYLYSPPLSENDFANLMLAQFNERTRSMT